MAPVRSTATQRRADAVAVAMRVIADDGLTTAAMQRVADAAGVSQPYVFRLFGSKRGLLLACLDEVEERVRTTFRAAAAQRPDDPRTAMGAAFRELLSRGVTGGLWLQASAIARHDDVVAARCRGVISVLLGETERLTGADADDLARFLADGALVVLLQAIGVDLSGGSRAAVGTLVPGRTAP
ncbi:TetR/AcrR family transcriptional regulator [Jiangella rhizosphaerae]|uniref:TetR/AcrR family transcriptional regulator n=1 Tax=Jiangella rhizosphaerae TaxID=2293569 RepID=A0A418KFY8_9ACTN|nr:TetR/AcrR family transcriptional regulator [Jiangella rhizosphaerae]RIQ10865.1 TetR/AcrR family transcriptional regulator [Jiangella rhizosphaerae]